MPDSVVAALIGIIPTTLGLVAVLVIAGLNWQSIKGALARVTRVSVAGVELELDPEALRDARPDAGVTWADAEGVAARAARLHGHLVGKQVLWVDDHPRNNDAEREFLRAMGLAVRNALSTGEALQALQRDKFDVVITDMERGNGDDGRQLAAAIAALPDSVPVICYLGSIDPDQPISRELYGLTDRPDTLVQLVLDAITGR